MSSEKNSFELAHPWGRHHLPEVGERLVRIGPVEIRMLARGDEILLASRERLPAHESGNTLAGGADPAPGTSPVSGGGDPEPTWVRWATPDGERVVSFEPVFPDRPVVLEPEQPFYLLPGARVRVYVRVPAWISVTLPLQNAPARSVRLREIVPLTLSDTWWGTPEEGELAFWLNTTARRQMSPELFAPHLVACPLIIRNRAASELRVEKLALKVFHFSIFSRGEEFWSDECHIEYLGEGDGSQIEMTGLPPEEASEAVRVTHPRVPLRRGLRARTFGRLAVLSGFGG
jgi:hypothetical protein